MASGSLEASLRSYSERTFAKKKGAFLARALPLCGEHDKGWEAS